LVPSKEQMFYSIGYIVSKEIVPQLHSGKLIKVAQ